MVQEERERWPFRSFIYNLKAREWPGKKVPGAWTPGANEELWARSFNSSTNAHTLRAIMHQVTCIAVFLSSVRSQNSTSLAEKDTLCSLSLLPKLYTRGRVQVHHCPQHRAPLGMLPLHIQDHWTAFKKPCASIPSVYFKCSESLWQNKYHLFRCGNCQVSS